MFKLKNMNGCVFCKIVTGEIPSHKLLEDDDFVAFLGIFPRFPGMAVVATKRHTDDSYLYKSLSNDELAKMHLFAKKVALVIDKYLGSFRCIQVMEGFEQNHAHLKLFPVYSGKNYGVVFEGNKKVTDEELQTVAEKIRKAVLEN